MNPQDRNRNQQNPDSADQGQLPRRDRSNVEDVPGRAREAGRSGDSSGQTPDHKTWSPRGNQQQMAQGDSTKPGDQHSQDDEEYEEKAEDETDDTSSPDSRRSDDN